VLRPHKTPLTRMATLRNLAAHGSAVSRKAAKDAVGADRLGSAGAWLKVSGRLTGIVDPLKRLADDMQRLTERGCADAPPLDLAPEKPRHGGLDLTLDLGCLLKITRLPAEDHQTATTSRTAQPYCLARLCTWRVPVSLSPRCRRGEHELRPAAFRTRFRMKRTSRAPRITGRGVFWRRESACHNLDKLEAGRQGAGWRHRASRAGG
jgi:hypothetical protein